MAKRKASDIEDNYERGYGWKYVSDDYFKKEKASGHNLKEEANKLFVYETKSGHAVVTEPDKGFVDGYIKKHGNDVSPYLEYIDHLVNNNVAGEVIIKEWDLFMRYVYAFKQYGGVAFDYLKSEGSLTPDFKYEQNKVNEYIKKFLIDSTAGSSDPETEKTIENINIGIKPDPPPDPKGELTWENIKTDVTAGLTHPYSVFKALLSGEDLNKSAEDIINDSQHGGPGGGPKGIIPSIVQDIFGGTGDVASWLTGIDPTTIKLVLVGVAGYLVVREVRLLSK